MKQKTQIDTLNRKSSRNSIYNGLDMTQRARLRYDARKRKIEKAYVFNETYDGTPGESALRFRRAMIAFDTKVSNRLGDLYSAEEVVDTIRNSMTGKAKEAVNQDEPQMIDDLFEFLEWYDRTFKLTGLREKLFKILTNWNISTNDDNLSIVQNYKNKLRLFELTYNFETDEVLSVTYLPPKLMVASIIKSLQIVKSKLHDELKCWTRTHKRTPKDLNELEHAIAESHDNILRFGTITNDTPKNPTIQPTVNAINIDNTLAEFKSNNELFSSSDNSNSNKSNKYNNSNKPNNYINNNGYNSRGRGRYRGGYRGRGGSYRGGRGTNRGGYKSYNNGKSEFN